jgi:hypothetical protein
VPASKVRLRSLRVTFLVALLGAAPTAGSAQGRPEIRAAPQLLQQDVRKLQLDAIRVLWGNDATRVLCIAHNSNAKIEDADSSFLAGLGPVQRFRPGSACSPPDQRVFTVVERTPATYAIISPPAIMDSIGQVRTMVSLQNGRSGIYSCDSRKAENGWTTPVCRKVFDL